MTISEHLHSSGSLSAGRHIAEIEESDIVVAEVIERLGFYPTESVIARWTSHGSEVLLQRVDLVMPGACPDFASWISEFVEPSLQYQPGQVSFVIVSEKPVETLQAFIVQAVPLIEVTSVEIGGYVVLSESGIWSPTCKPGCEPHAKPQTDALLPVVAPSRDALLESYRYIPELGIARKVRDQAMADLDPESDQWRVGAVEELKTVLTSNVVSISNLQIARIASLSMDVRTRDTFLWDIATLEVDPMISARILSGMLPHLKGQWAAPIATMAGICWWVTGNGARANICIDRALADDARYSLATLVRAALLSGLSPIFWIEGVQELTRDECLNGVHIAESA
jgi:hypothetical protein